MSFASCMASALLLLFDRREEYCEQLLLQGFDEMFYDDFFMESFAKSEDERLLSKRVTTELARREMWRKCRISSNFNVDVYPFEGNWLDELLMARKALLRERGDNALSERITDFDLDICRVRWAAWCNECFENRREATIGLGERILMRRDEIVASGKVSAVYVDDDPISIKNFVADKLLFELGDPAFKRIKINDKKRVFLAKRINGDLELRFCIECSEWSFSECRITYIGPCREEFLNPNCLDLKLGLHVRDRSTRRFSDVPDVEIPFTCLASPFLVYGHFRNSAHIAVAIAGWMALYRMVAKEVEEASLACGRIL